MSDRTQALAILKQARDALLSRLTESVLESKEEILDDAHGFSYHSQIETLQEQLGTRLSSVNSLLAHLQSSEEPLDTLDEDDNRDAVPLELLVHAEAFEDDTLVTPTSAVDEPATLDEFLYAIERDDMRRAARQLADLFGVPSARAEACATTFRDRYRKSPEFAGLVRTLRSEVSVSVNSSLTLLWECFGLAVPESIEVLETLRSRLDYA